MKAIFILCTLLFLQACTNGHTEEELAPTYKSKDYGVKFSMGYKKPDGYRSAEEVPLLQDVPIPDVLDFRGKDSPVENQGSCGSCWAFSLTDTLLDTLLINGVTMERLSQQYLVDCSKSSSGCGGGYFESADDVTKPKGSPSWVSYPYKASNGRCLNKPAIASAIKWHWISGDNHDATIEELQRAMVIYNAPLSVGVAATSAWSSYGMGVLNSCGGTQINHMVELVGFNNVEKFWIVKNSWGASWGESGYMRSAFFSKSGKKCNSLASEAIVFEVEKGPNPPEPSEFDASNAKVTVHGKMTKGSEDLTGKAKQAVQEAIDKI